MKILGEKSLSSKVENGLKILFFIIFIIDVIVFGIICTSLFFEFSSFSVRENFIFRIILEGLIGFIALLTGIVALFIIYQFIKIFRNLKENRLFEKDNSKYLNKIWIMSIIIGSLYFVIFIGTSVFLEFFYSIDILSGILLKILILIFSITFLIFGIGIKILNCIYKKAIEYKEENDFTI